MAHLEHADADEEAGDIVHGELVHGELVQACEVAVRRVVLRRMMLELIARDRAGLVHLPGGRDGDRLVSAAEDVIEDEREARRREAVVAVDLVRELGELRELIGDGLGLHQASAGAAEDDSDELTNLLRRAAEMLGTQQTGWAIPNSRHLAWQRRERGQRRVPAIPAPGHGRCVPWWFE